MSDTLPNVIVPPNTVVDLYAETGILTGTQITTKMIGNGICRLYAGASLSGRPDDSTGYTPVYYKEEHVNDAGDSGAFAWSDSGCILNVSEYKV